MARPSTRVDEKGVKLRETETANTAGTLHGSDPELADQVVIFSAHHDHLGLGEPGPTGDRIYNGALDNGVAIAQTLSGQRLISIFWLDGNKYAFRRHIV